MLEPARAPPWSTSEIAEILDIKRGSVVYLLRARGAGERLADGRYLISRDDLETIRHRKVGKPRARPYSITNIAALA